MQQRALLVERRKDAASTARRLPSMVRIPSGMFRMGSDRHYPEEAPARTVQMESFFIDTCPVTNAQFDAFVHATGYVTVAERPRDATHYPGVPLARLKPGALVFRPSPRPVRAEQAEHWWIYKLGAHWRCPEGSTRVFADRLEHPVTCVAYEDAEAYAAWAGKALPSEAQWEYAARGGLDGAEYAWGDALRPGGLRLANIWRGDTFPYDPQCPLPRFRTTPVKTFPPNDYGVYDMIGNVWEWTCDWYSENDGRHSMDLRCPTPSADAFDAALPSIKVPRRVVKGGSFLCASNYCARYRPAARQPQMVDTASGQLGFRCVMPAPPKGK